VTACPDADDRMDGMTECDSGPHPESVSYTLGSASGKGRSMGHSDRPIGRAADRGATAEPAPPALAFDGVSMTFPDGTRALEKVSFTVSHGEFVTLVGPSGCGKSTVLRLASGLLDQTAGSVKSSGNMAYVFQDATLLPWRTVQGNVELLMQFHGVEKKDRRRRAKEAIELVGLEDFAGHYPVRLSGGMKMRVSIARSITLDPNLFMFDEPFGALDEITRQRLNTETLRLFLGLNFAGLFVTHSVYEAVFMSTRVLVMSPRPGRIVQSIDVPFEYPREQSLRFEAEFAKLSGQVSDALRAAHEEVPDVGSTAVWGDAGMTQGDPTVPGEPQSEQTRPLP
jgi:NitT/TauT family transport system ATP-binding protein